MKKSTSLLRPSCHFAFSFLVSIALALGLSVSSGAEPLSNPLIQRVGVTRGICMLLGQPNCELAIQMAKETELIVYVQLPRKEDVKSARKRVDAAGFYGTRIYVNQGPYTNLHLADNIADALVALDDGASVPEAEALRVLRPEGKAILGQKLLTKPFPDGADDWSHPYHSPDNNPASLDKIAKAPYLTQFLADPRYAPQPQVAVASGGRIFKAFGHIAFKEREEPWLNTLAAFNGYNGTLLWRREIPAALMVHRNNIIATPTTLYYGDDKSCKIIDAATGEIRDELAPPIDVAGGTFWKWMGLEGGILYALIGDQEERDPVIKLRRDKHGWPWNPLSPGFNQPEHTWGYGTSMVAIDPATKKILWQHHEPAPIDSRAVCMKSGRIFVFRFGSYLTCLDAKTGRQLWRKTRENAPELFEALGIYLNRQDWRTNWRTTSYVKCSDEALYFSGPQVGKLISVSTEDGRLLWEHPYGNYQLVLFDDGLYGLSGQIDTEVSRKFDPLTGFVLEEIKMARRACTRPTGAVDAIFCRAQGGSTRLDLSSNEPGLVSPMRAQCQDGVTIANGLLYWWPSTCDCNLTLYGITSLGPAGDFEFDRSATEMERLERNSDPGIQIPQFSESSADWPAFRANNDGTVTTDARVPETARRLWEVSLPGKAVASAPTTVGGIVFVGGEDGAVRALDAKSGESIWTAYTGGEIRLPPTISDGRALVGSGDGWTYAFSAKTGDQIWRFRAAPIERRIPVYGRLISTWPASTGVLVENGVAYVAAGIVNYDGTHVYALDAATGAIKWQNNSSGHLDDEAHSGVSVQGQMMMQEGKLYLAGGNAVSPAIYDASNGKCLNDPDALNVVRNNNVPASEGPRGWELYKVGGNVMVSGKPYYSHPKYPVYDVTVFNKTLVASKGDLDFVWVNNEKLMCFQSLTQSQKNQFPAAWGKLDIPGLKPVWENHCKESVALAVCKNAVIVATKSEVTALNLADGKPLWTQRLPVSPVLWGLAVDRDGRVIITLENGTVICFG